MRRVEIMPCLNGHSRFGIAVESINLGLIFFLDEAAFELHARRQFAGGDRKFVGYQQDLLEFFKLCQFLIQRFDNSLIELLYSGAGDELGVRRERNVVFLRPVFQHGKMGRNDDGGKLAPVADDCSL